MVYHFLVQCASSIAAKAVEDPKKSGTVALALAASAGLAASAYYLTKPSVIYLYIKIY